MTEVMKPIKVSTSDWQSTSCTVAERFRKLFELAEWADCKFLVGTNEPRTEFLCHKLVLAASSPVFEALFYGSLAIKLDEPVVLPDMDAEHFQLFIKYLYTDILSIPDVDSAHGILYAAKKYLIPHLAQRCVRYLESNLCIDNLLDTLRIAECFKENKLRTTCLKMMCRTNPRTWWNADLIRGGALPSSTLGLLLDIMPLPERELDVFSLLLGWALASCHSLNLSPTGSNKRRLLNQYDLLSRVRFLRMKREEFQLVKEREILTEQESAQIEQCILYLESQHATPSLLINSPSLPEGFSSLLTPRNARLTNEQTYMRATLSNKTSWLYGGLLSCSFESDYSLLVTGFTVYTRLPFPGDYSKTCNTYEEKFQLSVKDDSNVTLCATKYHNNSVQYNSTLTIKLPEPFWVEPKHSYTILVEIERGQYPSYELA
ncbi:hypothetical protein WDU94_008754, partial [Cyamophila willieti]